MDKKKTGLIVVSILVVLIILFGIIYMTNLKSESIYFKWYPHIIENNGELTFNEKKIDVKVN